MAYLGNIPAEKYQTISSQQITGNGGSSYSLTYSVSSPEDIAVFVNNVRQNVNSYSVSLNTLTLGGNISASDECWVLYLGKTISTVAPANNSVTNDMLAGSIANAKLANSSVTVNGTSIALGASGNISTGITQTDMWRISSDFAIPAGATVISSNLERVDDATFAKIGTGMTQSSGIFTFPETGLYQVRFNAGSVRSTSGNFNVYIYLDGTSDNSNYDGLAEGHESVNPNTSVNWASVSVETFFNCTNTSTHKVRFRVGGGDGTTNQRLDGSTSVSLNTFTFIRLGDSQ